MFGKSKSDYKRGTLIQRIMDPYFGAGRDEFGTIVMDIEDRDLVPFDIGNDA